MKNFWSHGQTTKNQPMTRKGGARHDTVMTIIISQLFGISLRTVTTGDETPADECQSPCHSIRMAGRKQSTKLI